MAGSLDGATAADQRRLDRAMWRRRWREEGWHGDRTLADELTTAALDHPDVVLSFESADRPSTASLAEISERATRVAATFVELGLHPGDVLVIQVPNWVEHAITLHAALLAGLVVVPVVHIYGPTELGYVLRHTEAKALAIPDRWRSIDFVERLDAAGDLSALLHVFVVEHGGARAAKTRARPGWRPWPELEARSSTFAAPPIDADDVAAIIYTSGTTSGGLKGAQHTHNSLLVEARGRASAPEPSEAHRLHLSPSPAGHIAGLLVLLRAMVRPLPSVLFDAWDPDRAVELCLRRHPSHMNGAPFFYSSLLEAEERAGTTNRWPTTFQTGGASVAPTIIERFDATGRTGWRNYGSSEAPLVVDSGPDDPLPARAHTEGRVATGGELRIVDDDGVDLPAGSEGEVLTAVPQLFSGYFRSEALDADAFAPGGWFRTGDIGRLDRDGRLTITGRKKDLIIRGGENISAKEVEDILSRHPDVVEAAAVSLPDDLFGERLCAVVRLRSDGQLSLAAVRDHFAGAGVARQKTPEQIVVLEQDWPRTESGKVRKAELRALVLDGLAGPRPGLWSESAR